MSELRRLTHRDVDDFFALSQYAFQYERTAQELEEARNNIQPEHTWGIFEGGQLASKASILPLEAWIHGRRFAMGGIASVATWPEYRRQGMVARLLRHTLDMMKENNQSISFLAPFSFAFYRKFGWEILTEYKKYTFKVEQFPLFNATGSMKRVEPDIDLLDSIYEQYAKQYTGMLKRDEKWWQQRVFKNKKGIIAVYYNEHKEPRGYMIYTVKKSIMNIKEWVVLDQDSLQGLWQFTRNHDSMLKEVTMDVPGDDQLPFLLHEPTIEQKLTPYFMARIVDVESFLEQYPFPANREPITSTLTITDDHAPWNQGSFQIVINPSGQATVKRDDNQEENKGDALQNGLACTIQTLTTMLLGYQRPSFLYQMGRLKGNAKQVHRWEGLIPVRTTYLLDFF